MKPVLLALTALAILLAVVAPGFYSPGNLRELALNNVAAQGIDVVANSSADFARFMREDYTRWGKVIREAGIRAE